MKVFISHSSRDKWIARKLSEEIAELDCKTFLDEKDIETGESIDESIHSHLEECDDFLILLSPDSIKSHWVLLELGGALALKKRIVIILLYLGPNDIPKPISRYLARDINDVEKYYEEVRKRKVTGAEEPAIGPTRPKPARVERKKKFEVGDQVRLIDTPQYDTRNALGWNSEMDEFCGKVVTILSVNDEMEYAKIESDDGQWSWAFEWLTSD